MLSLITRSSKQSETPFSHHKKMANSSSRQISNTSWKLASQPAVTHSHNQRHNPQAQCTLQFCCLSAFGRCAFLLNLYSFVRATITVCHGWKTEATGIYGLIVLEAGRLSYRCWQGWFPVKSLSLASMLLSPPHLYLVFLACESVSYPLLLARIQSHWMRAHAYESFPITSIKR